MRRSRSENRPALSQEAGVSLIELLVALLILLIVAIGAFQFLDSGRYTYVHQTDLAATTDTGRATLDVLASDLRAAGYSPLGASFDAVPSGDQNRVQVLADHDGDGTVGTAGELDENLTYVFDDADSDGVFRLRRGVDVNGDGDFEDGGESVDVVSELVIPVDPDGDGLNDPFFSYDAAPPDTRRIVVTYGVRTRHRDHKKGDWTVLTFTSDVVLMNKIH